MPRNLMHRLAIVAIIDELCPPWRLNIELAKVSSIWLTLVLELRGHIVRGLNF